MKTLLCLAAALLLAAPVQAKVTRLEITSKQPYGSFRAGEYQRWDGTIHGEVAPTEPGIPDLDKAARNAGGMVEYAAKVILFLPTDPARGNGALLLDVPNRGKPYANALYNSPRGLPSQSGNLEPGTGFLQDQGYAIAEIHWELGQGADLPRFTDAEGKTRFVEGVGFAIVRDAGDFLAHGAAPNPLAGRISRALATGKSQDGRFLKTFLLHGFNQAGGRRVFDGMHVFVSGAGLLPILRSGTGPGSSADGAPSFAQPEFPGVHDGKLTIGEIVAAAEARGEVPPKLVLINSQVDYASIRASLGRTGAAGTADLPLPENVRMYDVAGSAHATVPEAKGCTLPPGRLDWAPVARSTLLHLDAWVVANAPPPPTTLMPLEPAADDVAVLQAPRYLPKAVVQVPRRDADGNALGGIRLPDIAAPLGVHGAQNAPLGNFSCSLVGAFHAFSAARLAALYKDNADYVNQIRAAAHAAEQAGFLLPEDAAVIVNSAAASPIFAPASPAGPPR
ncbi:MAG: alpha/beta hydrolase domain-containing protein [Paracraurococcus sp.]